MKERILMFRALLALKKDRGFTIVVIMVLVGVILAFTFGLTGYLYTSKRVKYYVQEEYDAINLAESGISKAMFCLNATSDTDCGGTYGRNYVGESKIVAGHGEYLTTVTGTGGERVIQSTGTLLNGSSRTVVVTVTDGPPIDPALSPDFAVQTGAAGIRIEDRAVINGPLYSSGTIRCDSLYNDINGPVSTSEVNGLIYRCDIGGDTRADRIWRCDVTGDAYYAEPTGIAFTTVSGTKYPYSTRPEIKALPVPNIDFWESSAEYGGVIEGDYVASTGRLGPVHIMGSLTVPTGAVVTVGGPIWVDDYVWVQDGGVLQLDPAFDRYGSVILIGDYDDPHPSNQIIVDCENLTSADDVGIVGSTGKLLDLEAGIWMEDASSTGEDLWGFDMHSSVDAWAVGNGGTIVHWDGVSWSAIASPTTVLLGDVEVVTGIDGWAVGANGTIIRWDGLVWQMGSTPPTSNSLYGIDALTNVDVWAVGANGTIIHRDAVSWSLVSSPTSNLLRDVKMQSTESGWAVGDAGTIIRWNGASWSTVASPTSDALYALSAIDADDAWAVGANGAVIRWNGASWSSVTPPVIADFRDVKMLATDDVYIVGTAGTILHWNGSSLVQQSSPVADDLQAVSGLIGQCANPPNIYGSGHERSYLMVIANGTGTGVDTAAVYLHTGVTGGIFLATHGRVSHIGASSVTHISGDFIFMKSTAVVNYDYDLADAEFSNSPPGVWRIKPGTWYEKE